MDNCCDDDSMSCEVDVCEWCGEAYEDCQCCDNEW